MGYVVARGLTIRSSGPLRVGCGAIMLYRGSGRLAQALDRSGNLVDVMTVCIYNATWSSLGRKLNALRI